MRQEIKIVSPILESPVTRSIFRARHAPNFKNAVEASAVDGAAAVGLLRHLLRRRHASHWAPVANQHCQTLVHLTIYLIPGPHATRGISGATYHILSNGGQTHDRMGVALQSAAVLELAGEPAFEPEVEVAVTATAVEEARIGGEGECFDWRELGWESDDKGVRGLIAAGEVAPPDLNGSIVGGGVEEAVVSSDDGVDWFGMGLDCFYAFEIGDSPNFY